MAGGNDTFAQAHEEPEDEGWLLSFADLVTNLMALFLVLYSMSDPDPGKFQTAAQSIGAALNAPPQAAPSPFADLVAQLNQEKQNAGEQTNAVGAQSSMRTTTFDFKTNDMFANGQADILPTAEPTLDRVAQNLVLLGIRNYSVEIEGHTDDVPMTNSAKFPSNWELSSARASAVARFLITRGVSASRITVIGYAETKPKVPNKDENGTPIPENRAENRRVVVRIQR